MTTEERVIDRKVIGSSNPIARKFRDFTGAIKGVGCGFLLLIVGIVVIYFSVRGVQEHSKTVESLSLQSPTELSESGMVKTSGNLATDEPIILEYEKCNNTFGCKYPAPETSKVEDILYYSAIWERFELVKEVRTETRMKTENGQDIEETVEITEYNEKWVEKKKESNWANNIKLDNIAIQPSKAKIMINHLSLEDDRVFIDGLGELNNYGKEVSSKVGDTRIKISYIPNTLENIIVVGEISNNTISDGDTFIITDKSDSELFESLKSSEKTQRLILRIVAWLALTIGFGMIIAPIMEIIEIVPILGKSVKAFAGFIGAVLSLIIVVAGVLIIHYWYIILILAILAIAGVVVLILKKVNSQ
jgi:hypothetical protein